MSARVNVGEELQRLLPSIDWSYQAVRTRFLSQKAEEHLDAEERKRLERETRKKKKRSQPKSNPKEEPSAGSSNTGDGAIAEVLPSISAAIATDVEEKPDENALEGNFCFHLTRFHCSHFTSIFILYCQVTTTSTTTTIK